MTRVFAVLLLVVAAGAALPGLLFLAAATGAVGLLGLACLLAIIARLAQGSNHHRELPASVRTSPSRNTEPGARDPRW